MSHCINTCIYITCYIYAHVLHIIICSDALVTTKELYITFLLSYAMHVCLKMKSYCYMGAMRTDFCNALKFKGQHDPLFLYSEKIFILPSEI